MNIFKDLWQSAAKFVAAAAVVIGVLVTSAMTVLFILAAVPSYWFLAPVLIVFLDLGTPFWVFLFVKGSHSIAQRIICAGMALLTFALNSLMIIANIFLFSGQTLYTVDNPQMGFAVLAGLATAIIANVGAYTLYSLTAPNIIEQIVRGLAETKIRMAEITAEAELKMAEGELYVQRAKQQLQARADQLARQRDDEFSRRLGFADVEQTQPVRTIQRLPVAAPMHAKPHTNGVGKHLGEA